MAYKNKLVQQVYSTKSSACIMQFESVYSFFVENGLVILKYDHPVFLEIVGQLFLSDLYFNKKKIYISIKGIWYKRYR